MYDAGPFAHELGVAHAAADEAGRLLLELQQQQGSGDVNNMLQVNQCLEYELATEAACIASGKWRWFVDAASIVIVLEQDAAAVLGLVWCEDEAAFAILDGGTYVQQRDAATETHGPPRLVRAGGDSQQHCIFSLPRRGLTTAEWSAELESRVVETFSEKWPLRVVRPKARSSGSGYCDGLLDVALGRADVAVSPPLRKSTDRDSNSTAAVVLGCLRLLLDESGGYLSDVYGEEVEFGLSDESGALAATARGLLACDRQMHNYVSRFMSSCFTHFRVEQDDGSVMVDLSHLAHTLKGFNDDGWSVSYEGNDGGK